MRLWWRWVCGALALAVLGCGALQSPTSAGRAPAGRLPRVSPPAELVGAKRVFALIVNPDEETRHRDNVRAARRALIANGVPAQRIRVLSQGRQTVTRAALRAAIEALAARLSPGDAVVVYVTGHGVPDGVVMADGVLRHGALVKLLGAFAGHRSVFVFDTCYAGTLPWQLFEQGTSAFAMAPAAEGDEVHCQLFSPHLWGSLAQRSDFDGDGTSSFAESFQLAMRVYNEKRRVLGMAPVEGAFSAPIPELVDEAALKGDRVIVQLTSEWCGACAAQRRVLTSLSMMLGARVSLYKLDVVENPIAKREPRLFAGNQGLPTLLLLSGGAIKARVEGNRALAVLLGAAREAFGDEVTTVERYTAKLYRDLGSNDHARARFAVRTLLALGRVDGAVARGAMREIRALPGKAQIELYDALRATPGYAALQDKLTDEDRAYLGRTYRQFHQRNIQRAARQLAAAPDAQRAAGLLALWRAVGSPGAYFELFVPSLGNLMQLVWDGDAEQKRLASRLLSSILELPGADGQPARVAELEFPGAWKVGTDALRAALADYDPGQVLHWGKLLVTAAVHDRGFFDVTVARPTLRVAKTGGLAVSFAVEEGPLYRWGSLVVQEVDEKGGAVAPLGGRAKVESFVSVPAGKVARRQPFLEGVRALETHYRDAGFANATVTPTKSCDPKTQVCAVVVEIKRGARMRFGAIEIGGNDAIAEATLLAALAFKSGQWFSSTALERSLRRVRDVPGVKTADLATEAAGDRVRVTLEIEEWDTAGQ